MRIDRIVEIEGLGYDPTYFWPDANMQAFERSRDWLVPHFWDVTANGYIRAIQSFVIRTGRHTILVDGCVGNDKPRPSTPPWDGMKSDWLDQLAAVGVHPGEVDYVLCTHLHADHVGWNTRLENGRWVPTFPNARYVFHRDEYRWWEEHGPEFGGPGSSDGAFEDSVLPVMAAGLATLVDNDFALEDRLTLDPTPGHSPGHVCINLRAPDGGAVFSGDVLHHPIQVAYPEWNSRFCMDPDRSRATRQAFVERYADTDTRILAAHFAAPTVGRIVDNGGRCRFKV